MEHADFVQRYLRGPGVEIGAFKTPIPGIRPSYVDRFAEYAGEKTLADYYGDACDLPFHDSSLTFVATSHVLEHVANPLAALKEWYRVLRHHGTIYMVVPDRRKTFDHPRLLTDPEHMLADYQNQVTQSDATHIDDFVYGVDWKLFSPQTKEREVDARDELAGAYRTAVAAGNEINIHFHTFQSETLTRLIALGNAHRIWEGALQVLETIESFPSSNPNGFLVVARITKPVTSRLACYFGKTGLKADARKFCIAST